MVDLYSDDEEIMPQIESTQAEVGQEKCETNWYGYKRVGYVSQFAYYNRKLHISIVGRLIL